MIDASTWRIIAAQASSIDERLAGDVVPSRDPHSLEKAQKRFTRWRNAACAGIQSSFAARLEWDGIEVAKVLPLLGDVQLKPEAPLPQWTLVAKCLLEAIWSSADIVSEHIRFFRADAPVPFEELLAPVVLAAVTRVREGVGDAGARLSKKAWTSLERDILRRISECVAPTFYERFDAFRFVMTQPVLNPQIHSRHVRRQSGIYHAFVADMRRGALRELIVRQPVLARVMATITDNWIAGTVELICRLHDDFTMLRQRFGCCVDVNQVDVLATSSSDLHAKGRSIHFLTFRDGTRVVYKPRSLAIDQDWANLLAWLDAHGATASAVAPHVVPRENYGWAEYIEPRDAADAATAASFFKRAGATLGLFHIFQGWDMHFENVIARGDQPIPVDLETLFHPWPPPFEHQAGPAKVRLKALSQVYDSVLACGYLPNWVVPRAGQLLGIGGLNPALNTRVKRYRFMHPNSDSMHLTEVFESPQPSAHLPRVHGTALDVIDYVDNIVAGFREMYVFLAAHKDALLASDGPLNAFAGNSVRVILRPTQLYFLILRRSLEAKNLGDGVDWSLHWDFLARWSEFEERENPFRRVLQSERLAMSRLDIPIFHARTDELTLKLEGIGELGAFFRVSSFDQVRQRIAELSYPDCDAQVGIIRQALESTSNHRVNESNVTSAIANLPRDDVALHQRELMMNWAHQLGETLKTSAIREEGGAIWLGVVPLPGEERSQLGVVGVDLYAGSTGIALFLSALGQLNSDYNAALLARAAIAPLLVDLRDKTRAHRLVRRSGIGGMVGIGSIVYGLTQMSRLLRDESLAEEACRAAALIDDERIARDESQDVLSGAAGALLGLLALYQACGDPTVLARARACGYSLIEKALSAGKGAVAWRNAQKQILTGFSHGAAGIAYALTRLYEVTADDRFRKFALNGLNFERQVFLPERANWPDLRGPPGLPEEHSCMCRWCHGAAGIGLSRAAIRGILRDDELDFEIATAVSTTEANMQGALDNLCCGNFGRVQVLLSVGQMINDVALMRRAQQYAHNLLAEVEHRGRFLWESGGDEFNPSFFVGISGIGYALLRMAEPQALPCVLCLAPDTRMS